MSDVGAPRLVKALHNFKGTNNDELCFSKGDLVTVTQNIEGGWWEGTLKDKTGWFPSNYVKEVKTDPGSRAKSPTGKTPSVDLKMSKRESMVVYHKVVLQNLIDTERTYVNDLQGLVTSFLRPLGASSILSFSEHAKICGNLEEIAKLHQSLLAALDECAAKAVSQQRIGGIFLKTATQIQMLYQAYCTNHPAAVNVLQNKKDELNKFMEDQGSPAPGIMTLTTSLSKPFARLEKYSNLLKEVERHIEESHVDRGDTQRAISVYREIAAGALERRKQKEIEYEILNSPIKGWEGDLMQDIHHLGEVLMLSQVRVISDNGDKAEQLFMLFPGVLVMLSVTSQLSGYSYEGKLATSGLSIKAVDDGDGSSNGFEISGVLIDRRIVFCATKDEEIKWVETLQHQAKHGPTFMPSKAQPVQVSMSHGVVTHVIPAKSNHASQRPYRPAAARTWSLSCLRPFPPLRPSAASLRDEVTRSPRSGRRILGGGYRRKPERTQSEDDYKVYKRIDDTKVLEEDAVILKVIEAYCSSAKARQTVNSSLLDTPSMLIAEEEKIIVEEVKGNQTVVEEKSLVDTVYSLKDQMREMKQEQQRLRKDLEDEKRARKRLETMLRKSGKSVRSLMETTPSNTMDGISSA